MEKQQAKTYIKPTKTLIMKQYLKYTLPALLVLFTVACGGKGSKEKGADLSGKKADLAILKKQRDELNIKIQKLEDAITAADPAAAAGKEKLVSVSPIVVGSFSHFVELQGRVDAENISYIAPRGLGGLVKAIYITKGQTIRKGQLVLKLDDAIVRRSIAAAKQSKQSIVSQYNLAKTMYERQKNLWDQNIGSEMQVIQAKSNMETLEANMKSVDENIKIAEEQLSQTNVYSDVSGYVDELNIRVGELFQGATLGGSQIKVVNTGSLKVSVNVPETHIGRVGRGSKVEVSIPDLNRTFEGTIGFTSQSIDPNQRGFVAEIKIPYDARMKPNQVAMVKILDYAAGSAVTVPVNTVQTDDKGKYVFVAANESGKLMARKRPVIVGEFYNDQIEIKSGLNNGDQVVTEGYQDLYDGQPITTGTKQ